MAIDRVDDLKAFRDFVDAQLLNGGSDRTPEECLELWILENLTEEERAEVIEEVRLGLEDLNAGRTRPAREALSDLRRKYNLADST